jgi:hypothetical protein
VAYSGVQRRLIVLRAQHLERDGGRGIGQVDARQVGQVVEVIEVLVWAGLGISARINGHV